MKIEVNDGEGAPMILAKNSLIYIGNKSNSNWNWTE